MEFFGEFHWPKFIELLPAYIGAFSGVILLAITIYQIRLARIEASKRAAFEFMDKEHTNDNLVEARNEFLKFSLKHPDSTDHIKPSRINNKETFVMRNMLNRDELLSRAVFDGALDEQTVLGMYGDTLVSDWDYLEPMIRELRQSRGNSEIGDKFEKLAKKWKQGSIK